MRIVRSDLNNGSIQSLVSALNKDVEDCETLNGALDDFIGVIDAKESLAGVGYNAIKGKLSSYKEIVNQRKQIATELATGIRAAVTTMQSHIEGYDYLDTSELETIQTNYNSASFEISMIRKNTNISLESQERINQLNALMLDLNKKIKKLQELPATDASAFGKVSNVSMTSFSSSVGGMIPIQINLSSDV